MPFRNHLQSYENLVTPYEATRAGFLSLALEKSRKATPFIEAAKALKTLAIKAKSPKDLLTLNEIQSSLLAAAGISDKAKNHIQESDKKKAILDLIENFIEPAGKHFVDELVYRFLLTKGDALGGHIRNLSGAMGEWNFTRAFISTLSVRGIKCMYFDLKSKIWMELCDEPDIEKQVKGMHWTLNKKEYTLIYNLNVPIVGNNVDFCLFDCSPDKILFGRNKNSVHYQPEKYLALGELKGGLDPAGADEHWKTANSALERIRSSFATNGCSPHTFFVGAAIEKSMAKEIYQQLVNHTLSNGANLTNSDQVVSLCAWLIELTLTE